MKPYQRREQTAYPYYRVAIWCDRSLCWHDLKKPHPTKEAARNQALAFGPGRYRISEIDEHGRFDLEPFTVT